MYVLGSRTGWRGQRGAMESSRQWRRYLHVPTEDEVKRMRALMAKYKDVPMDSGSVPRRCRRNARAPTCVYTRQRFPYLPCNEKESFEVIP